MLRNFSLGKMKLTGVSIKDPRVAMRAIIGVLLAANLAAAVIAFKAFGGSAGDLGLGQAGLGRPLTQEELNRMAKEAGARPLPSAIQLEPIEGSDTLRMATITAGYEGTYANLKKFVEMVDKSPRFLIIENMTVVSPQQQQAAQLVNVSLKLDTFVREAPEATS